MTGQRDFVQYGTTEIAYDISRSDRRHTVAITVHPDQSVRVTAPKGLRKSRITPVVLDKAQWILACWEQNERTYRTTRKSLVSGESLRYLGRQYPLKVRRGGPARENASASLLRGRFVVTLASRLDASELYEATRSALVAWYRDHARRQLVPLAERMTPKLGVECDDVQIRDFAQRWGSTSGGAVRINWRVIMASRRLVEYVVAHELCHLRHNDHSCRFWRMLSRFMPDYEERKDKLQRIGPMLDL
jgi:hypothetical protein